jgi:hypothetical protein
MTSGYSGTPLAKKLSLKDGMRVWWDGMPQHIADQIAAAGIQFQLLASAEAPIDAIHIFVTDRSELQARINRLLPLLEPAGMIWVSWPKKASKIATEISEDVIRAIVLPMGLVDVKVCAVDSVWSGLRLVIRRQNRAVR